MKALWNAFVAGRGRNPAPSSEPLQGTPESPPPSEPLLNGAQGDQWAAEARATAPGDTTAQDGPDLAATGGLLLDAAQTVLGIDPVTAALFGYAPAELTGRSVTSFIPHGTRDACAQPEPSAVVPSEFRAVGLSKEGKRFPIRLVVHAAARSGLSALSVMLHQSHELEVRGDIPALVVGWQAADRECTETQEAWQDCLAKVKSLEAENLRLRESLASGGGARDGVLGGVGTPLGRTPPEPTEASSRLLEESRSQIDRLRAQLVAAQAEVTAGARLAQGLQAEVKSLTERASLEQMEFKVQAQANEAMAADLASARALVATAQQERDAWKARGEEARAQAEASAAAAAHWEQECARLSAGAARLEQEAGILRQQVAEAGRVVAAADARIAEQAAALAAGEQRWHALGAEAERLRNEFQQTLQHKVQAESELQASAETMKEVCRELASARVVLETLQQERDLWQAQSRQAQMEAQSASMRLAAAEERQRQLEKAVGGVTATMRRAVDLATTEMKPLLATLENAVPGAEGAKGAGLRSDALPSAAAPTQQ